MAIINQSQVILSLPVSRLSESFPAHFAGRFPFQKLVTDNAGNDKWEAWTIQEMTEDEAYKRQFGGTQTRTFDGVEYAWINLPFDPLKGDFSYDGLWSFGQNKTVPEGTTWNVHEIESSISWEQIELQ